MSFKTLALASDGCPHTFASVLKFNLDVFVEGDEVAEIAIFLKRQDFTSSSRISMSM